ncbi:MAG: hypothetical protein ACE5GF_00565 [Thermodesulfobacteriota bacterium]
MRSAVFLIGIVLIVASFLVYPVYLVIPLLAVSLQTKAALFVGGSVTSWGIMGVGGLLAGREGYPFLKERIRRAFGYERYY